MRVPLQPVAAGERQLALDASRGLALLGVALVNLHSGFRASLFTHLLTFHTHPGVLNRTTDVVMALVLELKAFALLALLFGIGVGMQTTRAPDHALGLLARRFTVLLLIGLIHMLLIWNGDILVLYAICGLIVLPFTRLSARWLAIGGIGLILVAPHLAALHATLPDDAAMRAGAAEATRIYGTGTWTEILAWRWRETALLVAPLLIGVLPRTIGLMALGLAAWRAGVVSRPSAHRPLLVAILVLAGGPGLLATALAVWSRDTGAPDVTPDWLAPYAVVLLALAYGAGLWLWWTAPRTRTVDKVVWALAATGRMTLTHYLAQSVIFGALVYGYGAGLFGRVGPAPAALVAVVVFVAQMAASVWWLERFRFGPAEWLWRSLTYRRWLPMARAD
jgi:uncharacterized protein